MDDKRKAMMRVELNVLAATGQEVQINVQPGTQEFYDEATMNENARLIHKVLKESLPSHTYMELCRIFAANKL